MISDNEDDCDLDKEESSYFKLNNLNELVKKFFVDSCGMRRFSDLVNCELSLKENDLNFGEDLKIKSTFRKFIQLIQPFLYWRKEFRQFYFRFKKDFVANGKLSKLKFFTHVEKLSATYSLNLKKCEKSVRETVDCKFFVRNTHSACDFLIKNELVKREKEIIKCISKMFVDGSPKLEKEFINYLLLINDYTKSALTPSDKKEIEKDHAIKLSLPESEPFWIVAKQEEQNEASTSEADSLLTSSISAQLSNKQTKASNRSYAAFKEIARDQQQLPGDLSCMSQSSATALYAQQVTRMDNEPVRPHIDRFVANMDASPHKKFKQTYDLQAKSHQLACTDITHNFKELKFSESTLNEFELMQLNSINDHDD